VVVLLNEIKFENFAFVLLFATFVPTFSKILKKIIITDGGGKK
jgi:hypothetical protein